jgi:hypothetical protein
MTAYRRTFMAVECLKVDPKLTLIDARLLEVRITLLQGHSNDCERAEPCHLEASSEHQWRLRSPMLPRSLMPGIPASRALEWRFSGCLRPNAARGQKTLPQQDSPGSGKVQTGRPIDVATPHHPGDQGGPIRQVYRILYGIRNECVISVFDRNGRVAGARPAMFRVSAQETGYCNGRIHRASRPDSPALCGSNGGFVAGT